MAHLARVSREAIYEAQTLLHFDENAQLLQGTMAQSNKPDMDQPTWQQEQKFHASTNLPKKNQKWKKLDYHTDTVAGNVLGDAIVPIDSPALPPSSLHPHTPSTPALSESTYGTLSHTGKNSHKQRKPQRNRQGNMTKVPANIPPHRRKQQQQHKTPASTDTAKLTPKTEALKLTEEKPAELGPVQLKLGTLVDRPDKPLSPPSSPAEQKEQSHSVPDTEPQMGGDQMNALWGWKEPDPEPPTQPKKKGDGRRPSHIRKGRHVWPKNRDMKPQSDEEDEDGGIECKSDSNGDPDYDVKKLIDWNGDWLPPPPDWSGRHVHTDRHFGASIEKWMNGHDTSCTTNLTDLLRLPDYLGVKVDDGVVFIDGEIVGKQTINKEIAPRSWIPIRIEGDAPQTFWKAYPSRAPSPISNIDISEHRPFWEDYPQDSTENFLNPIQHPTKSVLDLNDEENCKPGAGKSATQYLKDVAEKNQARERRRWEKRNRAHPVQPLPPRNPGYRPTANVYFRPVVPADAKSIRELYNHYVEKTISVPEFKARSVKDIVGRIDTIVNAGLPYIVAVYRGRQSAGPQNYVNEPVVGIVYIDDYVDKGSAYRFTFELECFVHPDFVRQNIAKCLLDRLLEMVNTSYPAKGGYEWLNRSEYLKHGSGRVVKVLSCSVPHEEGDDMAWMTEFMRKFKFRKAGHLFKMGYKLGKVIDVTIYQHETTELIDADVPPLEPL